VTTNPFSYGSPVADSHLAGRTDELAVLIGRMTNGINVVVTPPRAAMARHRCLTELGKALQLAGGDHPGQPLTRSESIRRGNSFVRWLDRNDGLGEDRPTVALSFLYRVVHGVLEAIPTHRMDAVGRDVVTVLRLHLAVFRGQTPRPQFNWSD
jgi:hypothetical protein